MNFWNSRLNWHFPIIFFVWQSGHLCRCVKLVRIKIYLSIYLFFSFLWKNIYIFFFRVNKIIKLALACNLSLSLACFSPVPLRHTRGPALHPLATTRLLASARGSRLAAGSLSSHLTDYCRFLQKVRRYVQLSWFKVNPFPIWISSSLYFFLWLIWIRGNESCNLLLVAAGIIFRVTETILSLGNWRWRCRFLEEYCVSLAQAMFRLCHFHFIMVAPYRNIPFLVRRIISSILC